MGIVSDSEFDKEVTKTSISTPSPRPIPSNAEIIDYSKGRGNGNLAVPDGLRKIIGEESIINGRQSGVELASRFGISPSSASSYAVGAHSTSTYNETADGGHTDHVRERVIRRAKSKLSLALKHITPEKLIAAKPRDLAGIAKDMSAVIKNMEPETPKSKEGEGGPTFVFYAPQFRDERNFEVVVAKDNI